MHLVFYLMLIWFRADCRVRTGGRLNCERACCRPLEQVLGNNSRQPNDKIQACDRDDGGERVRRRTRFKADQKTLQDSPPNSWSDMLRMKAWMGHPRCCGSAMWSTVSGLAFEYCCQIFRRG